MLSARQTRSDDLLFGGRGTDEHENAKKKQKKCSSLNKT